MAVQGTIVHHAVLEGIENRMRPFNRLFFGSGEDRLEKQRTLKIYHRYDAQDAFDRQSAQHFVNHIHSHLHSSHPVQKLHLFLVTFSKEALNVLCDLLRATRRRP
jgi:hypothetical protein